jgi:chaperonin GroEL (HSP60 family)
MFVCVCARGGGQANITVFRRMRKTDQNRIARACGATIVSRADEIQPSDVGTGCGLFKVPEGVGAGVAAEHTPKPPLETRRPLKP